MVDSIELNVEVSRGHCESCERDFDIYRSCYFSYGLRLMLTDDGTKYGFVNCDEDKTFNEVVKIVKDLFKSSSLSQMQIAECFNKVFGITCDLIDGKRIDASRIKRTCIYCGSEKINEVEQQPPKIIIKSFPTITHKSWEQKSAVEKNILIEDALKSEGCLH